MPIIRLSAAALALFLGVPALAFIAVGELLTAAPTSGDAIQSIDPTGLQAAGASAQHAVLFAQNMLGVPYLYGGNGPGGFDCSGLVWAAYAGTPAQFARMGASDEYSHTPRLPLGWPLGAGDLVFFADGSGAISHVGIFIGWNPQTRQTGGGYGMGVMIDAPHSGATVRYDDFSPSIGAAWGDEYYVGATSPEGL
ncbi:MAG TPA: NlpC/P60 family protein [Acidimicrobiales bacterium]|nr:NlpC/P60 family protein [Acidimicrobiales bacterium]